jgi:NitT/TauT family transport system substrate-binding protein
MPFSTASDSADSKTAVGMHKARTLLLAAAFVALACGTSLGQAPPLVTIHATSSADDGITPVLYAEQAGLFRKVGIDVVVQKANSGSAVAAAVASGAMDIGRGSLLPIVNAYAHGIHFIIVAPSSVHVRGNPDSAILVPTDSMIHSARDLNGKVISVPGLFDLSWLATKVWLEANGADDDSIRFIEVPNSAALAALESGRVAASTLSEPFMSLGLQSGKARYLGNTIEAISPNLLESAWYASADYNAKHADLMARFRRVVEQATAYTNAHPAETVDLLASLSGMEPAAIAQIKRATNGTSLDPRDIQPLIDAAAKYKIIPQSFSARELL